jgi:TM2 domain-containing membrane protein YozV
VRRTSGSDTSRALVASGGSSAAAMALGILGIVVKGLFYLLFTGIGVLLVAFLLGAFWMRRRNARRRPAR